MKRLHLSVLVFLAVFTISRADGADAVEKPVVLEPYNVEERPFGFIGIKHATVSLSPLKLIAGMNAVKFLKIDELEAGSPGIAAGVLPGDRIVSIDGVAITKMGLGKLKRMNRELEVGQKLRVEVLRPSDGSTRTVEITVPPRVKKPNSPEPTSGRRPAAAHETFGKKKPGLRESAGFVAFSHEHRPGDRERD